MVFEQLIWAVIAVTVITVMVKYKSWKLKAGCIAFAFIAFFMNPFRSEVPSSSQVLEHFGREFEVIEKVEVEQKTFDQRQKDQFNQLKNESKGLKNEIHN